MVRELVNGYVLTDLREGGERAQAALHLGSRTAFFVPLSIYAFGTNRKKHSMASNSTEVSRCSECSAITAADSECRDRFHALLAFERSIPEGVGESTHFLAVAAYVLQHSVSMDYSNDGLEVLRASLEDLLSGTRTLVEIRTRMGNRFEGDRRIRAASDESVTDWHRNGWTMFVTDVINDDKLTVEIYRERVDAWARSVAETLAASSSR